MKLRELDFFIGLFVFLLFFLLVVFGGNFAVFGNDNGSLAPGPSINIGVGAEKPGEDPRKASKDSTSTAGANLADHLVISEIYYDAEEESDSEFIELYNPTGNQVKIAGWSFSDDGGDSWVSFSEGTDEQNTLTVPAKGFILLVDGGWKSNKDNSSWPSGDVIDEISLTNGGGTVKIRDSEENIIDSVTYKGEADNGQGVERKASPSSTGDSMRGEGVDADRGNAYDTDSFSEDFVGPLPGEPQNSNSETENYENNENKTPTAAPGGPYVCEKGEEIRLDGSASSDPDGSIVSYEWDLDGDDRYDDLTGAKPYFSPEGTGNLEVGLKVTDDSGATDKAKTTIEVGAELEISISSNNLTADGSTTTGVSVSYVAGTSVDFSTEAGELSSNKVTVGSDGTAEVTLTAPDSPGASVVKVTSGESAEQTDVAPVYFHEEDEEPVEAAKVALIPAGIQGGKMDLKENIELVMEGKKDEDSVKKEVVLMVGKYGKNPVQKQPFSDETGLYLNSHVDKPSALNQLELKIYLEPWPEKPAVKFLSDPKTGWLSCSSVDINQSEGYVTITIDSGTKPSLSRLSDLVLVAGAKKGDSPGTITKKIRVTEPGWNMVSMPLNPVDKSPKEVFGGLGPKKVQRWGRGTDGRSGGYVTAAEGFSLRAVRGNWVYLSEDQVPRTFKVKGTTQNRNQIVLPEKGWYQIGFPADTSLAEMGARKGKDGKIVSLDQAASSGWMWRFLWEWNRAEKTYYAYEFGVNEKSLEPKIGYWIRTKEPNIRLVLSYNSPPPPPSETDPDLNGEASLNGGSSSEGEIPAPPGPPELFAPAELDIRAFPNPVMGGAKITFEVIGRKVKSFRVRVYDGTGRKIFTSGSQAGPSVTWNLLDRAGAKVVNGTYLGEVRVEKSSGEVMTRSIKLLLIK